MSPATITEDSDALFALSIPTKADYAIETSGGREIPFTITQTQKTQILRAGEHFKNSLTTQAELLDDSARELLDDSARTKLHKWLQTKKKTFKSALDDKRVLHFDILVLGIVSTAVISMACS